MSLKLSAAVLLLALLACTDAGSPTQTVVAIDAEPAIKALIKRVAVTAASASGDAHEERSFDDGAWPVRLVLSPRAGDAARRFQLDVVAYGESDKKLIGFSFASGYVAKASRYALIVIQDTCVADMPACVDSSCNAWQPDPAQLGPSRVEPWKVSITCGTRDPGHVVMVDAGMPPATMTTGTAGQTATASPDAGPPGTTNMPPTSTNTTGSVDMGPCDAGFVRSNLTCVDVDECPSNPCGHGMCENLTPGFMCHCDTGYESNGATCVDIDECTTDNGGCADTCVNDEGSAHCTCGMGSWLKQDGKGCAKLTAAEKLSTSASTVQCYPQVASDAMGNAVATWMQSDGMRKSIWTDRFVAGQGWMGATKLTLSADVDADSPQIVLDAQGRGLLVWIQNGTVRDLWAARYSAGAFGAPTKIETNDDGDVFVASAAIDANGNGYVVWTYAVGSRFEIWGNRSYQTAWLGARKLAGSDTVTAGWGRVALDDKGRGLMVWSQADITDASADSWNYAPYARRFDPTTLQWGTPFNLDDSGQAALPDVHLAGDGSGAVVWQRRQDSRVVVLARWFDPQTGSWGQPLPLSAAAGSDAWPTLFPSVALSTSNAAAMWSEKQGSAYRVWASDARGATPSTRPWSKAGAVSPADSVAEAVPAIALDVQGNGFGVWSDIDASAARKLYALRVQAASGFDGTPIEVTSDVAKAPVSPAALSFDMQGNAVVVWDTQVPTNYEVWARRFE